MGHPVTSFLYLIKPVQRVLVTGKNTMNNMYDEYGLDFDFEDEEPVQESYNPSSSHFKDLFDSAFNSFDPDAIIAGGNNRLKSGQFDMDIEESDLAIGYKQPTPPTSPKPGRFM